jgi:aspartyl-tRNA(Asn)/glutamyl-tRNA(Gln) amidotransferase subunit A
MNTISSAAIALRSRRTTSVEITRQCLARIAALQPTLNAFLTVITEQALQVADIRDQELRQGQDRGPLHGIPVALKDVFETKGIRTTCGSLLFAQNVPARDSAVAERLASAGAVLVGKTAMHELAYGVTSSNPHFGSVRNPWDPDRVPGGSSGGSGVAVATGMCFMAMGSDTGGSIRIPAAFCGTVGLKPTYGRVSLYGVMPLDFTLDHMGPLTRTVRDAATVLQVLAGADPRDHTCSTMPVASYDPISANLSGVRIGVPENFFFEGVDRGIAESAYRMAAHAEAQGAHLVRVTVPDVEALNAVGRIILMVEASATLEPFLSRRDELGADVRNLLDQGRYIPATEYVQAQRVRHLLQQEFATLFQEVDCLLTPTTPNLPPKIGETHVNVEGQLVDARLACTRNVRGFNVLGLPALVLPAGLVHGLPASVQLIGPAFGEAVILKVGAAIEGRSTPLGNPPVESA